MADGLFGGAYTGNPNIQRQGARARALAQQRDVNTLPDPRTYAAVSGLFGTPPDQMGFSVLNPQYESIMRVAEPAFAAGTALGVAPMVGLGARLAGRTLGPTAARMTEGYMQRQGMMPSLDVYHGSPHKFDKFDSSKIGTGEGAQAYGNGLYLAEAKDVGSEYAKNLANRDAANQGRLNAHANAQRLAAVAGDPAYAADDIKFVLGNQPDHPQKQLLSETLKHLESGTYKNPLENSGYLYKVDLPDDQIAKMLNWDKPLSQQAPEVQEALKRRITDVKPVDGFDMGGNAKLRDNREGQFAADNNSPWILEAFGSNGTSKFGLSQKDVDRMFGTKDVGDLTGEQVITRLAAERGSQAAASEYLKSIGIPGIRYLDGGSRGKGAGTSNFVVFPGNERLLNIMERNGEIVNPRYTDPFPNTIADTTR